MQEVRDRVSLVIAERFHAADDRIIEAAILDEGSRRRQPRSRRGGDVPRRRVRSTRRLTKLRAWTRLHPKGQSGGRGQREPLRNYPVAPPCVLPPQCPSLVYRRQRPSGAGG